MSETLDNNLDMSKYKVIPTSPEQVAASEIGAGINNKIIKNIFNKFSNLFSGEKAVDDIDKKFFSFISIASSKIRKIEEDLYEQKKDEILEDVMSDKIYNIIKDDYPELYNKLKSIFI